MQNHHTQSAVYFGGSRNLESSRILPQVVQAVLSAGQSVHVGCQRGADQQVISCCRPSSLFVFAVAPVLACAPVWVQWAQSVGASVTLAAGGQSAPMPARFLLRSIAAFQGCSQAVFFQPGAGSLAVARECVRQGLQVFAFQAEPPAPVPSVSGQWVTAQFMGFACWQWQAVKQFSLF